MWYEGFKGVLVNEPTPGPVDMAKVNREQLKLKAILAKARKELGMDEATEAMGDWSYYANRRAN